MEILHFLLSFFLESVGLKDTKPLLDILKENDFDIGKALKNINLDSVAPVIKNLFLENENPTESVGFNEKFLPISNFADKRILSALQAYFAL